MFLNNADDETVRTLVKTLSAKAKQHNRFRAFVYFQNVKPESLKKLNKELGADNIALCMFEKKEREKSLKLYKINPKAKSTVMVYLNRDITANIVNFNPKKDKKALEGAIDKICK